MYGLATVVPLPFETTSVFRLHFAIEKRDTMAARAVLEESFWNKTEAKPDALHLLHAMKNSDRDMVRLLLGWNAGFTAAETAAVSRLLGPEKWRVAETLLRGGGHKASISAQPDPAVILRMANGLMERFDQYGIGDRSALAAQVDATMIESFLDAMKREDFPEARRVAQAAGVQEKIDIDRIFSVALQRDRDEAYNLAINIKMTGLMHKPLVIAPADIEKAIPWLPLLAVKGILSRDQGAARSAFLDCWFKEMRLGKLDDTQVWAIRCAVPALFNAGFPASTAEAQQYINGCATYCRDDKKWSMVEEKLDIAGFFDGSSFTAEQLRQIACTERLRAKAVRRAFFDRPIDTIGTATVIPRLAEAFNYQALPLDADNVRKTVKMLYKHGKGGVFSRNEDYSAAQDVLLAMRDAGGNFSKVDPMDYMGRRDPGMAKMMLDMGISQTCHYDLSRILKKTGGKVVIGAREGDKEFAYTQFICQLLLENSHPHLVMELRGKKDADYQKIFVERYLQNGGASVNFDYSPKKGMKP